MIDIDAIIDSMRWSLDANERSDMRRLCQATLAAAAEQSGEAANAGDLPDSVIDATAAAIGGDAYDCMRVWSAWGVGTMGPDDFVPIADDGDRVAEIARAAIEAYVTAHPAPVVLEGWRTLLEELAQYAPKGLCAPTALQGFAMRAARLLTAAPATGKESLQVQAVPGISDTVIDDLRQAFANAARWGGHEACHQVNVRALLAGKSPN